MAERYATQSGLWEAATFNGGTLPGAGDTVHANGYTVTVDQSFSVSAISKTRRKPPSAKVVTLETCALNFIMLFSSKPVI